MNWIFFRSMPIFFWLEVAAFATSLVFVSSLKRSYLIWFIPFLLLMVVVETFGKYLPKVLHRHNAWIFNFSVPIEYIFYSFIFIKGYFTKQSKQVISALLLFYIVFCVIVIAQNGILVFQNKVLIAGNLLAIICSCGYFFEVLKSEEILDLPRMPLLWIACGVFLFNIGEITYTLFRPVLTSNRWDVTLSIFKTINNRLIFWLYGCIIIGLVCSRLTTYRKTSGL